VNETLQRFGHIDVWVNNAGKESRLPSQLTDDDIDEMMMVTSSRPFTECRSLRISQSRGEGR